MTFNRQPARQEGRGVSSGEGRLAGSVKSLRRVGLRYVDLRLDRLRCIIRAWQLEALQI
jgi:hypothetical protein